MDAVKNFAYSNVVTAPSPALSGGTLTVTPGHGTRFPTAPFNAVVWPTGVRPLVSNAEIVRVTAIVGDALTFSRTQEGSGNRAIVSGDQIAASLTKQYFDDLLTGLAGLQAEIDAAEGDIAGLGAVAANHETRITTLEGTPSGINQLTGDVTAGPGAGSQAATIAALAVTTGKIAALAVTDTKLAADSVLTAKILDANVTTPKIADLNVTTGKLANLAVDATKLAADAVITAKILDLNVTTGKIADGAVTNAKQADMNAGTYKMRVTGSTGAPENATPTQATAGLNVLVGDSGAGGTKGLAPAPTAGDGAAGKVLYADATWKLPPPVGAAVFVRKTVDETVTSSTTLQADDELFFHVPANETWEFEFRAIVTAATAGDFRCGLKFPTSPTEISYDIEGVAAAGADDGGGSVSGSLSLFHGTADAGVGVIRGGDAVDCVVTLRGFIRNGANAGLVVLWWAQGTSSGSPTAVTVGSWVVARRVAGGSPITLGGATGTYTFAMGDATAAAIGLDPADSTTYIFGDRPSFEASTSAETLRVTMPKAGVIKSIHGIFVQLGVTGTGESSTLTVHNRTQATSQTISAAVLHNAARTLFSNTALSLAFNAGDEIDLSWLTPAWATNPTDVVARADMFVEFTGGTTATVLPGICDGRLTLETAVPVSTSDQTAKTSVFFTPYRGNQVALFDGTFWAYYTLTERTLALGTITSGKNYDIFLYNNAGTLTLELSAAWASDTARTDALVLQDGVYVKSGAPTRRYVGMIRTTSTTTTEDSAAKRFVWNAQHRTQRQMRNALETADSWNYTLATWRQANANAANQLMYVVGLAEDAVTAAVAIMRFNSTNNNAACVGVGVDSTSVNSAHFYGSNASSSFPTQAVSQYAGVPGIGYHFLAWLEYSAAVGTCTWYGDAGGTTIYQAGMSGTVFN